MTRIVKPIFDMTINGQPASKANRRRMATIKGKPAFIKSPEALVYAQMFGYQCPVREPLYTCDIAAYIKIFYTSYKPDLDESVVLDGLQNRIIKNDRQVKLKVVSHGLDKENPRAHIVLFDYENDDHDDILKAILQYYLE